MGKVAGFVLLGILVIIVLVIGASWIANIQFNRNANREVEEMFRRNVTGPDQGVISQEDMAGLPASVQKWLTSSQVIGKERIRTVRSKQKASLRLQEGQSWLPADTEYYYTTDQPGLLWKARIKAAPLIHIAGRDKYDNGRGHMLIKLLSLFTVANAGGSKEIDQGSLLRYLAESVWFPTAALNSYIEWEEIDAGSARATMSYKGVTADGVFYFNEQGDVTRFVAERYMDKGNGRFALETWSVALSDHREFDGFRIPAKGEVTWELDSGDFTWYRFTVEEMEYNNPAVY